MNKLSMCIPDPIKHVIFLFFPRKCIVFGIGSNSFGELGETYKSDKGIGMQKLLAFSKFEFKPQDIFYGYLRFTIKTTDNKIYSMGNNTCGDCGVDSKASQIPRFTEIDMTNIKPNNNELNDISAITNSGNTMLFCINDIVYGNGSNHCGQFGIFQSPNQRIPYDIQFPFKQGRIIQIECGYSHTLFLNDKGQIFSCGKNEAYQCGLGHNQEEMKIITRVECHGFIKKIDCGSYFNLCLSDKDQLYVFGSNNGHQCGIYNNHNDNKYIKKPMINPYFKERNIKIMSARTKDHHCACIDLNEKVYLFGQNGNNKISKCKEKKMIVFEEEYPKFKDYSFIQGVAGSDHTILLSDNNQVIGFGGNGRGQTKPNSTVSPTVEPHIFTSKEIGIKEGQKVLRVIATNNTTLIVCDVY